MDIVYYADFNFCFDEDKKLKCEHLNAKQHFPVVLFTVLCKLVLMFESVDESAQL